MRLLLTCILVLIVVHTVRPFVIPKSLMEEISEVMENIPFLPAGNYYQKTRSVWNYLLKLVKKIMKPTSKNPIEVYNRSVSRQFYDKKVLMKVLGPQGFSYNKYFFKPLISK